MVSHEQHGDARIFPDEIKQGVAGDGKDQDTCLPAAIFGRDFRRIGEHDGRRRGGLEHSEPAMARSGIGRLPIGRSGNHAFTVSTHRRSVQQKKSKTAE